MLWAWVGGRRMSRGTAGHWGVECLSRDAAGHWAVRGQDEDRREAAPTALVTTAQLSENCHGDVKQ